MNNCFISFSCYKCGKRFLFATKEDYEATRGKTANGEWVNKDSYEFLVDSDIFGTSYCCRECANKPIDLLADFLSKHDTGGLL